MSPVLVQADAGSTIIIHVLKYVLRSTKSRVDPFARPLLGGGVDALLTVEAPFISWPSAKWSGVINNSCAPGGVVCERALTAHPLDAWNLYFSHKLLVERPPARTTSPALLVLYISAD
ncbi:hypothetical protein CBL_04729 [Carabus blaptoides fortunei]